MVTKKEIINAVKKNSLYEYVCAEYWNMSKNDVVNLLKETLYAIYEFDRTNPRTEEYIMMNLADSLTDLWGDEIEEEEEFNEKWGD